MRIHRAGEGAPYSGLKPAGEVPPGIALGDKALEKASAEDLLKTVQAHLAEGVKERFDAVVEAKKHSGESVEKGREFVAAYVIYLHYVEALVNAIHGNATHDEGGAPAPSGCKHGK